MDERKVKERILQLRKAIHRYRYLYHVLDRPEISDAAHDSLKKELELLEQRLPHLITKDSPTQRVGGEPLDKFEKVRHETPMLSFNDGFSAEDIKNWFTRFENHIHRKITPEFYCELKIDGLAIELVYENGMLVRGSTRGDGLIGENITQSLKTIEAIPLVLEKGDWPKHLVIRGEVFLDKKEFGKINRSLEKEAKQTYANPRNLAAGTLRQLDPKLVAKRKLDSFAYDIVTDVGVRTHEDEHRLLKDWGFKTNKHNKVRSSLEEVFEMRTYWDNHKKSLLYEIDGLVIIINQSSTFQDGGVVGKAPRGAIAYKFTPEEATTVVKDVKVQVGRTGVLTPVAHLEPVNVRGVTITHATLHNFDEIKRIGVKIGDTVIVTRSGDVIPKITSVLKEMRTGKEKPITVPTKCPVDNSSIVRDGVYYRCSNKNCGAKNRRSLQHFVSRSAFNIDGLGRKIIDRFLDEGLIVSASDIFKLKREDIAALSQFGEKSADNIVSEIEQRKDITLPRFLYSLGIPHVGEETADVLSTFILNSVKKKDLRITDIMRVMDKTSIQSLEGIQDVGPKVGESIKNWFSDNRNRELLQKFEEAGVNVLRPARRTGDVFSGLTFVITGTLDSMSRPQAKEKIKALGGHVASSVSSNTSYVVAGSDPGSKLKKAGGMRVKVISEKEFLKMLNSRV